MSSLGSYSPDRAESPEVGDEIVTPVPDENEVPIPVPSSSIGRGGFSFFHNSPYGDQHVGRQRCCPRVPFADRRHQARMVPTGDRRAVRSAHIEAIIKVLLFLFPIV